MKTTFLVLAFIFNCFTSVRAQEPSHYHGPKMDIGLLDIKQENGFVSIAVPEPDTTSFIFFFDNGEALPIDGYVGQREDGTPDISFADNGALMWVDSTKKLMYGVFREIKQFAYR